jgi:hypothetical protein
LLRTTAHACVLVVCASLVRWSGSGTIGTPCPRWTTAVVAFPPTCKSEGHFKTPAALSPNVQANHFAFAVWHDDIGFYDTADGLEVSITRAIATICKRFLVSYPIAIRLYGWRSRDTILSACVCRRAFVTVCILQKSKQNQYREEMFLSHGNLNFRTIPE